jgi:hypothetical protein
MSFLFVLLAGNLIINDMSFYSLSNVADSKRAAKGLLRVLLFVLNLRAYTLEKFGPPKNKKCFPFLRSFSLCGLEFPEENQA